MCYIEEAMKRHGLEGVNPMEISDKIWDSIMILAKDLEEEANFQEEDHRLIHRLHHAI